MRITGIRGYFTRRAATSCRPLISGINRSVTTRSTGRRASLASASRPFSAYSICRQGPLAANSPTGVFSTLSAPPTAYCIATPGFCESNSPTSRRSIGESSTIRIFVISLSFFRIRVKYKSVPSRVRRQAAGVSRELALQTVLHAPNDRGDRRTKAVERVGSGGKIPLARFSRSNASW